MARPRIRLGPPFEMGQGSVFIHASPCPGVRHCKPPHTPAPRSGCGPGGFGAGAAGAFAVAGFEPEVVNFAGIESEDGGDLHGEFIGIAHGEAFRGTAFALTPGFQAGGSFGEGGGAEGVGQRVVRGRRRRLGRGRA